MHLRVHTGHSYSYGHCSVYRQNAERVLFSTCSYDAGSLSLCLKTRVYFLKSYAQQLFYRAERTGVPYNGAFLISRRQHPSCLSAHQQAFALDRTGLHLLHPKPAANMDVHKHQRWVNCTPVLRRDEPVSYC